MKLSEFFVCGSVQEAGRMVRVQQEGIARQHTFAKSCCIHGHSVQMLTKKVKQPAISSMFVVAGAHAFFLLASTNQACDGQTFGLASIGRVFMMQAWPAVWRRTVSSAIKAVCSTATAT